MSGFIFLSASGFSVNFGVSFLSLFVQRIFGILLMNHESVHIFFLGSTCNHMQQYVSVIINRQNI